MGQNLIKQNFVLNEKFYVVVVNLKKNAQWESCELSFIWGSVRTAALEKAPQIALQDCSKEAGGKDSICVILVKGEYTQSRTYFFVESFCWSHEASVSYKKQSSL